MCMRVHACAYGDVVECAVVLRGAQVHCLLGGGHIRLEALAQKQELELARAHALQVLRVAARELTAARGQQLACTKKEEEKRKAAWQSSVAGQHSIARARKNS